MNRENTSLCLVFAMGMEASPFLARVEVRHRWKNGKTTYREAFFEGRSVLVVRSGIGPNRAAAALDAVPGHPSAVLSVGTAGALTDGLRVGEVLAATETVAWPNQSEIVRCSESVAQKIEAAGRAEGLRPLSGRIVTVTDAVFTRERREQLHKESGAVAVDMESHALAVVAKQRGVPFGCLRVISDDLSTPPLPDWPRLKGLWRRPMEWRSEMAAMLRWRLFLRDFRRCVNLLAPVLVRLVQSW
ncbi:MAG: hypothetical protein LDL33_00990 [Desulfomonile sp.]|nr:hypothetical protein [Desulfomonile sp.]